jgi:hypothetical protein
MMEHHTAPYPSRVPFDHEADAGHGGSLWVECRDRAARLRELLEIEAESLRHFDLVKLLDVLPRKERLIEEFAFKYALLGRVEATPTGAGLNPATETLRESLEAVQRLNSSNGLMIKATLSLYSDLLECFCPGNYTAGQERLATKPAIPKGLALHKEV